MNYLFIKYPTDVENINVTFFVTMDEQPINLDDYDVVETTKEIIESPSLGNVIDDNFEPFEDEEGFELDWDNGFLYLGDEFGKPI